MALARDEAVTLGPPPHGGTYLHRGSCLRPDPARARHPGGLGYRGRAGPAEPLQAGGHGQAAQVITWAVAAAGLLAGAAVAWIVSHGGPDRLGVPDLPLAVPVVVLVGWSFIGSGLLYWRSRPGNHLGAVLIFQGFAWFASMLTDSHNPVLFTFAQAVFPFQYVSGLYLILSLPTGRLRGTLDRVLVAATLVLST